MIKGYCKFGKLDLAIQTFDRMKTEGVKPDEVLYNSLLDGCSKNGQSEKAFQFYE